METILVSSEAVKVKVSDAFEQLPGITNATWTTTPKTDSWLTIDDGGYGDTQKTAIESQVLALEGVYDKSSAASKAFVATFDAIGNAGNIEIQYTMADGTTVEGNFCIVGNLTGSIDQVQRWTATCTCKGKPTITLPNA